VTTILAVPATLLAAPRCRSDAVYVDLPGTPNILVEMLKMAASNAAHLAKVLKAENYPGVEG
jgi:hypothetical protein